MKNKGIVYRYSRTINKWWYQYTDNTATWSELSETPFWLKWVLRSPWLASSIAGISGENAQIVTDENKFEPITLVEYPDNFSRSKIIIISDYDGYFESDMSVPENVPTGKHAVKAYNVLPIDFNPDRKVYASDEFAGESYIRDWENQIYKRKIEQIIDTLYVTHTTNVVTNYIIPSQIEQRQSEGGERGGEGGRNDGGDHNGDDPLAQSFVLNESQFLSGIDLFFKYKNNNPKAKAFFNIREMENGYPSKTILYQKVVSTSDINVGSNYPVTHIEFDKPVYIEGKKEYAFTIGCNIDGFHILYAKMGARDIITNEPVIYQPHTTGVMFVSSNNSTWTALQDSDIKYVFYGIEFDNEPKTYYFLNINQNGNYCSNNFNMLNVTLATCIFENTDIILEYAINAEDPFTYPYWQSFTLEEMYNFIATPEYLSGMNLSLRATLMSSTKKLTPVINADRFEAFFAKYKTIGSYIQIPLNLE